MDLHQHEYILEVFADQTFVKDIVKGTPPPSARSKSLLNAHELSIANLVEATDKSTICRSPAYNLLPPIFPTYSTLIIHANSFFLSHILPLYPVSTYPTTIHTRPPRNLDSN